MAIELNRDNFESEVTKSSIPVLVDLWGPQCKPCLALMPSVEELAREYDGQIKLGKINAAENRMLCAKLRVLSLPAFLLYKDGEEVKRLSSESLTIDEIRAAVEDLLA